MEGVQASYEKYPEQTETVLKWLYDVNERNDLFVQGLRDSVREADPYYISARGDVENYIVENVERADIWTSYYAGRCGGDMIKEQVAYTKLGLMVLSGYYTGGAMGGSLEGFFSRFTLRGALANGGGMLIPGTAVAAGSEAGAVVIGTLGGINLVDVWLRRTEASQGMGEAIRKGRQKAEVEKGTETTADFEKRISELSPEERVAAVKEKARKVAQENGLVKDSKLSKMNGRDIYKNPETGEYYSVDTQHGRFEYLNKKGKHLGEVDFDFNLTKPADTSGGHNIYI